VPLFATASNVVDIGCGRGELLELFRDHGVAARGIDTNQAMVDECQSRGLDVSGRMQ
jgi:O-antigen chain-terminating methyltransferase